MCPLSVSQAVAQRRSTRAFLDQPVPDALLREVLELAARAPSGGNLQPWRLHIVTGAARDRLIERVRSRLSGEPDLPEYDVYPGNLWEPYRARRFELGCAMYRALQIPRDDKKSRLERYAQNFSFFGAPVGLFCYVHRGMSCAQWSDLGMYLQTLMLLLEERGLASCAQESWSAYHRTVDDVLKSDQDHMLFCGMSIGFANVTDPVNQFRSERAALESFATFHET